MNLLTNYTEKHKEIMDDATAILKLLEPGPGVKDADEVRKLLSFLAGKLKVHLAAEDRFLYPMLLESNDAAVRKTAEAFVKEMGGIYGSFSDFLNRWPSGAAIREKDDIFSAEMKKMIQSLAERIHREDSELYPLARK